MQILRPLLTGLVLLLGIFGARAQTATVGSQQFVFSGGRWQLLDAVNGSLWTIDSTIYVRYKPSATSAAIAAVEQQFGMVLWMKYPSGARLYKLPVSADFFSRCDSVRQAQSVDAFTVNSIAKPAIYSNDFGVIGSGGMSSPSGQLFNTLDRLRVYEAWEITTGSVTRPVVAVVDAGTDWEHTDLGADSNSTDNLYDNIWVNSAEDDWTDKDDPTSGNGVDDDQNGIIDDYKGVDFGTRSPVSLWPTNDSRPWLWALPGTTHGNLWTHGTSMSGLIGAKTNNATSQPLLSTARYQVAGVAGGWGSPGCRIMDLKVTPDTFYQTYTVAAVIEAVIYATTKGADVINLSLTTFPEVLLEQAVDYAYSQGTIVVASAGNGSHAYVDPPAGYASVVSVGGTTIGDTRYSFSQYGAGLDVMAPAYPALIAIPNDSFYYASGFGGIGTSGAAALVSGVVALMKDVNPCLTPKQVDDLLKNTADKPGATNFYNYYANPALPGWNKEMGYGIVDARMAVEMADSMQISTVDLYIKDRLNDFGLSGVSSGPNVIAYTSPDIWVRNQNDGVRIHQNPKYQVVGGVQVPQWVYVRVRNRSCVASPATGMTLEMRWTRAATNQTFPAAFNPATPPVGGTINSQVIPVIPSGDDTVLVFQWYPPAPVWGPTNLYYKNICLFARIRGSADPLPPEPTVANPLHINAYAHYYNNVALRNTILLNKLQEYSAAVTAGSRMAGGGGRATLHVFVPHGYPSPMSAGAAVDLVLDSVGWTLWDAGGRQATGLQVMDDAERRLRITDSARAVLRGFEFSSTDTAFGIQLSVHFPADSTALEENVYALHMQQTDPDSLFITGTDTTELLVGGEEFLIYKETRQPFWADAGPDKTINKYQAVTLAATSIGEGATYRWYDPAGTLVDSGQSIQVSPLVSEQYQLEVIATADGFIGWDSVAVAVRTGSIGALYPNPATTTLNVPYALDNVASAYLFVTSPYSNTSSSYILNTVATSTTINTASYAPGVYSVVLICDGQIMDAASFVKQ